MASFKKTNSKIYIKSKPIDTDDTIYWKKIGVPVLVKEFGAIDHIDFSPVEPYYFAVTCSIRVQLYNPITKLVAKNISRFRESAYGGTFRKDGKLLCAGGEESHVKLFDVSSKSMLRLFSGHTAPVHRTSFTSNMNQIASFSDDKSVKLWDIPSEKSITNFMGHKDYIRAGCCSPVSPNILLSGGYDGIINMWDDRDSTKSVIKVDHGNPVESVLFLPTGGIFLTAGGTDIKVWDVLAGRLLAKIIQHHKTVTCLRLASENKRLLSGSLDRHVKVYDISTYNVIHTIDYPSAVLSLAISKNDETLVAGMVDGLVSIHRRDEKVKATKAKCKIKSYKYASNTHSTLVDTVVPETLKELQSKHDTCLRKFEYSKALDIVLQPYVVNKNPHVTVSLMQELLRRKGLHTAVAGRDMKIVKALLRFLIKYIGDHRFTRTLIDVANVFLDVHDNSLNQFPPDVIKMIIRLGSRISEEEQLSLELANLEGAMHLLLAGSSVAEDDSEIQTANLLRLKPSEKAKQNIVIDVN
ncbi:U3 small nucleolar RNA-associated protein 15 homolog [Ctenocephalides felis]|uniref:U3 small nucleolar RNA-associated protein 15 homolog n=1 Tax=Ctenocephalides felis TaxID=7515 RepID=UPI000E6E52CE|nr:U3 small nucleolar RNA-associated protein 15 homolog [Ctenocephalides felis]